MTTEATTPMPESAQWIANALTDRGGAPTFIVPRAESGWRSRIKRGLQLMYRPIRPIARPLVWRLRTFIVTPLLAEHASDRRLFAQVVKEIAELREAIRILSLNQAKLRGEVDQARDEINSEIELMRQRHAGELTGSERRPG